MLLTIGIPLSYIFLYRGEEFKLWTTIKLLFFFIGGILFLCITIPSLLAVITKDYDVVTGTCTIEITSHIPSKKRHPQTTFNMSDTDEDYFFNKVVELDEYGKSVPYYCEITVTKDHMWEIDYKIFDLKTRELLN